MIRIMPSICLPSSTSPSTSEPSSIADTGIKPADLSIAMELGSPEAIKGAVEAGMGVSIVSEVTIHKELQLGTLVSLELDPPLPRQRAEPPPGLPRVRARAAEE